MRELDRFIRRRLLERFTVVLLVLICILALGGYALAETPLPQAPHSALDAAGPQAAHILDLWRIFLVTCTAVFSAILVALLYVLWRRPRARSDTPPDLSSVNRAEPGPRRSVNGAVAVSTVLLLVLIVASVFTDRALARLPLVDAVNIEVTAHQWWWTARYVSGGPSELFETANEIHIPVGRPVVVKLKSDDVIHSLWVPNLAGKKDLVPGRTAVMQFRADKAGVYRGQCAEFCGFQHALMGLLVTAEPLARFEACQQTQRAPAAQPTDPRAQRGKAVFESTACAMCHSIQGTPAQGRHAPDLTHLAGRQTLAAGTLPNTPEALASWIADPQKHKPGTNMPTIPLSAQDREAIAAYLGSLK
jgi:cytochrome c oxidase subunit II